MKQNNCVGWDAVCFQLFPDPISLLFTYVCLNFVLRLYDGAVKKENSGEENDETRVKNNIFIK